jgi:hypothetical protein
MTTYTTQLADGHLMSDPIEPDAIGEGGGLALIDPERGRAFVIAAARRGTGGELAIEPAEFRAIKLKTDDLALS